MIPASHIKKTIDFNARFRGLLEVLKLVAVSQYHQLEKRLKTFELLKDVVGQFFQSIDLTGVDHPFLNPGDRPMGVVAVTSDAGLLGGMNMQVVSKAVELVRANNGQLIIVGERGQSLVQDWGMSYTSFPGIVDATRFQQSCHMRDLLTQNVMAGKLGAVKIVYPRAVSLVINRVETETFIPFSQLPDAKTSGPAPESPEAGAGIALSKEVIFESTPRELVENLVYVLMGQRLFEIFGMARLAEQAARFTHLEESGQKILELNRKLQLQYFRRRHEMIDAQMRELFASRSTYAK